MSENCIQDTWPIHSSDGEESRGCMKSRSRVSAGQSAPSMIIAPQYLGCVFFIKQQIDVDRLSIAVQSGNYDQPQVVSYDP